MTDEKKKPGFWSPENLRSLFFLILLVLCFRWSIASPYHVPTASMEPTIKVGDRLLAFKLSYGLKIPFTDISVIEWGEPERGDIIVFRYPKDTQIDYVKRVVGKAGDRIRVENNRIFINGKAQEKTDHNHDRDILADIDDNPEIKNLFRENLDGIEHWVLQDKPGPFDVFPSRFPSDGEFTVPEGSLFVMGDNRDNSTDSRAWGVVPLSYVRGKALFVIWSMFSEDGEFLPNFRFQRFGHGLQ
ncbi:signal peptidase I [Pseudobacteriovorax antillogorgiicola]|uniref:Signal peptidase I n=1 Tax=Pseudobacteriovorax antillogorgiicola TaxID=1513793 RepID=A0A1Y6BUV1_9BACT|nr:signal peptidase I [Pseudobacteriovorax antillogorgiicola]TCS53777.1 signal peptidase I [Pseudobacteriovorax antillogorgiicola]SMF22387.1 signal peptidase I Serine peptidase. MEROPS family S26A [Pseudobacteriovorax antillogorgiicola]